MIGVRVFDLRLSHGRGGLSDFVAQKKNAIRLSPVGQDVRYEAELIHENGKLERISRTSNIIPRNDNETNFFSKNAFFAFATGRYLVYRY